MRPSVAAAIAALCLISVVTGQLFSDVGSTSPCDPATEVACRNHPTICISLERIQDGVADCPDASDEECSPLQFACPCGQPRCISSAQVADGIIDCADGSDEGLVGVTCKTEDDLQDIMALDRKRRFADFRVEVNGGQTTTFDLRTETPSRRPMGLITETKGIFVNAGTTTEYATQIVGTSIDGTYAKIQSTNSRVFSVLPTLDEFSQLVDLPTGVVSSSVVTRIRGETTTIETTEFLRTFVDETYVQEIVTASEIFAPLRAESDPIQPSVLAGVLPTVVIDSSQSSDEEESGKIHFKTAHLTQIVGERTVLPSAVASSVTDDERETAEDDHDHDKKLISSFDEPISDDRLEPSTIKAAALPTLLAGQSFDDLFTASHIAEMASSPTAEAAEDSTSAPAEEPQVAHTGDSSPQEDVTEAADGATTLPPSRTGKSQDEPEMSAESEAVDRQTSQEEPAIIPETEVEETVAPVAEDEPVAREPEIIEVADPFIVLAAPVAEEDESQRHPKADQTPFQIQTTLNIKTEPTDVPAAVVVAAQEASEERDVEEPVVDDEITTEEPETAVTDADVAGSSEQEIQPTAIETPAAMTTFTFFTTFFVPDEDGSTITTVSSREVIGTDLPEEPESSTEPESSLLDAGEEQLTEMVTTLFTTYTYFTTFFDDQTTILSSHEEVVSNVLTVTEGLRVDDVTDVLSSAEATETADLDAKSPSSEVLESSMESTVRDDPAAAEDDAGGIVKTFFTTFTFFTTALEGESTVVNSRIEVLSNVVTSKLSDSDQALWESLRLREDLSSSSVAVDQPAPEEVVPEIVEIPVAAEEQPAAEIEPSPPAESAEETPAPVEPSSSDAYPKTFYTTFTYFTTFFTEGTSEVVSREETITNVVSSSDALLESTMTPILSVYPVTYYTTFTYRTTSYSLGETFVSTREETVSNVVTPGVDAPTEVEPTASLDVAPTEAPASPLTTFYTTFTYFTTTFDGDSSVVSSSMETVTNIVSQTPAIEPSIVQADSSTTARAIGDSVPDQLLVALADNTPSDQVGQIGLLSTIRSSQVNQGVTTLFTTDILGTLINGQYAKILESSSEIIGPKPSIVAALPVPLRSPTGVLSVNIASVYNVDHPTTTVVTSRAIGTYVGDLYAQLIETSTSFQVDSLLTVPADEPFRTGLIRVTTGQIVKDSLTTAYQTRVIGTFLNGLYAEILESTSSVASASVQPAIIIAASEVLAVEPTDSIGPIVTSTDLEGSIQPASESPASGASSSADENEEVKGVRGRITTRLTLASRSRTFTPSIRPFTQRVRPPLTLKKKRPPFPSAANEDSSTVDAAAPVAAGESSATETSRSSFSRFRTSIAPAPISILSSRSSDSVDTKNRFFRPRVSSFSSAINPTPVIANGFGGSTSGRRLIGSSSIFLSSSTPRGSSSIGGRRSSIGSSFIRGPSSILAQRSSTVLAQPSREVDDQTTEQVAEVEEGTEANFESATSRTTFTPRQSSSGRFRPKTTTSAAPQTTPSTPASRRSFPLSRASPLRTPNSFLDRTTESERDAEQSAVTTARPRFVRPPKVTFTVKPRAAVSLLSRRPFKKPEPADASDPLNAEGSSIDEVVDEHTRTKRQIDYDYYFYDPAHYRRPSRGSSKTRTRSSGRFVDDDAFDYIEEELVFEDEPVTARPRNPVRDRINAQKAASSQRNSSNRRPSSSSSSRSQFARPSTARPRRPSSNRQSSSSRSRSKQTTTERSVGSGRRFGNNRRPSNRNKLPEVDDFQEKPQQHQQPVVAQPVVVPVEVGPPLAVPVTVTHQIPTEATIPVIDGGHTEFKTVITAKPSVEILQRYATSKVSGTWRYIASEISATPTPGVTEVTQYVIKGSETSTVTFTPTTIRGRPTSFSHLVPSTVYEIEPVVSTISDPLAATNNLLQQLLLGGLQGNPLLGATGPLVTTPVTSFSTFTTTYVTTLTEQKTTKFPITLRGKEIFTTLVNTATQVITATEFSTETVVITPSVQPLEAAPVNPLASLLPALLQANPLLQAQLNPSPTPAQVLPIATTEAPQSIQQQQIQQLLQQQQPEEEIPEQVHEQVEEIQPSIVPAAPVTSVVTLFLSGRRPGEFSSVLSTIVLDGPDATVVKRQTSPSEVAELLEVSALPFMVATEAGVYQLPDTYLPKDLDYYLVSAINEIGAEEITDVGETHRLESIVKSLRGQYKSDSKVRKVRQIDFDAEQPVSMVDQEAAEAKFVEQEVLEQPSSKSVRRKTVTVTRKKGSSTALPDDVFEDEWLPGHKGRKIVVVSRRKIPSVQATASVESSIETNTESLEEPTTVDDVAVHRRVAPKKPVEDDTAPLLASSKDESPLEGPAGDVYAPRTYFTVYSYLYTVLNGPNSGLLSTRQVSISEIVRGTDGRIPNNFRRTENGNGLYTLSVGRSIADLNTRVVNGITTQVNLASLTLVKYGRGPVKASSSSAAVAAAAVASSTVPTATTAKSSVAARLEPSFESFSDEDIEDQSLIKPTQRLPAARGRTAKSRTATTKTTAKVDRFDIAESVSTTSSRRGANRGRGTVRFGSLSSIDLHELAGVTAIRASPTSTKKRTKTTTRTITRRPTTTRPVFEDEEEEDEEFGDFHDDDLEHDEVDDYENEFDDDLPQGHHDDYSDEHEDYHDEEFHEDAEHESKNDIPASLSATSTTSEAASVALSSTTTTPTSTKIVPSTPTRSTISRKTLNPLESHLRSILAHSRSSFVASSVSSFSSHSNDPSSSTPFRSRLSQRFSTFNSLTPALPSTVVFKTFSTTSTLPVDGRRSGIALTLITSTLTTLIGDDLQLLTQSPELFKPVIRPTAVTSRAPLSVLLRPSTRTAGTLFSRGSSSLQPSPVTVESSIEDVATDSPDTDTTELTLDDLPTPSPVDLSPSIDNEVAGEHLASLNLVPQPTTLTVVETELRTFTAVVTRKSGTEEEVTTRLQVLPRLVTRTIVQVQPTPVADVLSSIDADENNVPTARAIPSGEAAQVIESHRQARLNIGNPSRQNLATKVMSNGVELIIAGEKKPSLLAQNVIQHSETIVPSPPVTLAASTLVNHVTVGSEVQNVHLLSSIQLDPAQFVTQTQRTTFTYFTTLMEGESKVVSSREEVITNLVTQETGRPIEATASSSITLNSADFLNPEYQTVTYFTTFTYFNTFMDLTRPVVVTSKETVSNVVTVPVQPEIEDSTAEPSFDTKTYLRTYTFTKSFDDQVIATSKEVVTQIVVTEAPIQATPVVLPEVTKTYLNTVTILTTTVEDGQTLTRKATLVSAEVVTETLADEPIEATPVLEGSKIDPTEEMEGPLVATKTYFTTSTHYTTLLEGSRTVVQSRKEVTSTVVTETISGFDAASFFAPEAPVSTTPEVRPTYVRLGPNLYGKLRTLFATATYFITNSAGDVTSKNLVIPQISTETVSLSVVPAGVSVIEASIPEVEATAIPETLQLSPEQLNSLKESFLSQAGPSASFEDSFTDSPDITVGDENGTEAPGDIDAQVPDVAASAPVDPAGSTGVILVTNSAGEVLILPTEVLGLQPTSSTSGPSTSSSPSPPSSSGGVFGGAANQPIGPVDARIPQRPPLQQGFIPLRQPTNNQRPPPIQAPPPKQPQPGIPIKTGPPPTPVLRPGQFQVIPGLPLTQVPGQPVPVRISFPTPETGFTAMTHHPTPVFPVPAPTRVVPSSVAVPNTRPVPPPPPPTFFNGANTIDRGDRGEARPASGNQQFFAANGQAVNVPPLPVAAVPPPPPPPPQGPQQPVQAFAPGAIVPGPEGKPVRIIGVPEGQRPPPGAEGQVFIRPVPEQPPFAPPVIAQQPPRREDVAVPPVSAAPVPPRVPPFQSAVQTIASIEGDNKIVRTNIISGGQTFVLQPTDSVPQPIAPSSVPVQPAIEPSVPAEVDTTVAPAESSEAMDVDTMEVVGNILKPGLVPSSSTPHSHHEFNPESESGEASHTPTIESIMNSTPSDIIPSIIDVSEIRPDAESIDSAVSSPMADKEEKEPFGITSVIMGPVGQVFTTFITRFEPEDRTVITTIADEVTEVNYVTPSTAAPTTPEQPIVEDIQETSSTSTTESTTSESSSTTTTTTTETTPMTMSTTTSRAPSPTFPAESPFNPPTIPVVTARPPTATPSTTSAPATTKGMPVTPNVQENKSDNKAVLSGILFGANQPPSVPDACNKCSKEKQEVCFYGTGEHKCICRPGFSRSHSSMPCIRSYSYQLRIVLERFNESLLHYEDLPQYDNHLRSMARSGLKQVLMKTDLSSSLQDSHVMEIRQPTNPADGVVVDFIVQLDREHGEDALKNELMKSLEATNFILGDSEIVAARFTDSLQAEDFDECSHEGHHDCSDNARCINQPGTYTCECKQGFVDSSDDVGRSCLAEKVDCEKCHKNGRCVVDPVSNEEMCLCNRWFAGQQCQVNLKVVMIAVLTVGIFLILLITAIIVICCLRSRRAKGAISSGPSFLRYRGPSAPVTGTLDRTAMIRGDTSSESSGTDNYGTSTLDGKGKPAQASGPALQSYRPYGETLMIPRAKHHHPPTSSAGGNSPSAAERGEMPPMSAAAQREQQLLEYLEGRKKAAAAATAESVSGGGRTSVSSTSQFRDSLENVEAGTQDSQDKAEQTVAETTVSEARSFDETTIHPAVRRPAQYYQSDESDNSNFDSL